MLLLFLLDFVTIALASDRTRISRRPSQWRILPLTACAIVLGLLIIGEQIGFVFLALHTLHVTEDQLHTLGFELIFYFSVLTTLSVRDRRHFSSSQPVLLCFHSAVYILFAVALTHCVWCCDPKGHGTACGTCIGDDHCMGDIHHRVLQCICSFALLVLTRMIGRLMDT